MSTQFPPPSSFMKSYGSVASFGGNGAFFASGDLPTPCTVRRIFYLPNTTAGQPTQFPLRLVRLGPRFSQLTNGELFGGVQLGSYEARAGQELIVDADIDVPESGWRIGTWLSQTTGTSMIQSCRFSVLPWVDGARPNLKKTQRPRNIQRFNFSGVSVGGGTSVIRSTPLIGSPYIITTITYRCDSTTQTARFIRPFVGWDIDTTVPAGTGARVGAVPGEDILARTRDANGIETPGHLGCHTQWQNARPWKNVRFVPSAIKLLFQSLVGTVTFNVTVEIEYLPPKPWWKEASLLELARGV